jgi:hypothetical protein
MKRSIRLTRLTPSAGFTSVAGMMPQPLLKSSGRGGRAKSLAEGQFALARSAILPPPRGAIADAQGLAVPELNARNADPTKQFAAYVSVRGFVLSERLLELLHDGVGIAAGLAHVVDPLLLQRLGRLPPFLELRVGDRIDLVARLGLDLGQPRVLEIRPWVGEFPGPLGGAVVVDDFLLRAADAATSSVAAAATTVAKRCLLRRAGIVSSCRNRRPLTGVCAALSPK